jgi:hypothetical protein
MNVPNCQLGIFYELNLYAKVVGDTCISSCLNPNLVKNVYINERK